MLGITVFIILNFWMIYSCSVFICKYLKDETSLSIRLISISILYIAQISITVLFLGRFIGVLNWKSLFLLNAIIGIILTFISRKSLYSFKIMISDIKNNIKEIIFSKDYILLVIIMLFLVELATILVEIVIAPPTVYDVFTYHLQPVVDWYQNQRIVDIINTPVTRVTAMPLGLKFINFWWVAFWGNTKLVEMPQFIFSLILVLCIYNLMRCIKVKKFNAIKYSILIFFMPLILIESSTCQDHVALVTLWITSLMYFMHMYFYSKKYLIYLFAISIGLFWGLKSIAIVYIFILLICVIIIRLFYRQSIKFKINMEVVKKCSILVSIIIALSGYWYIRNFAIYGSLNGNYKDEMVQLNLSSWNGILSEINYRMNFVISNIRDFIPRILDYQGSYTADATNISGFGIQFFTFGLLGYIVSIILIIKGRSKEEYKYNVDKQITFLLLFSLLLQMAYFVIYYTTHNYRLFLLLPIIGIIVWAFIIEKIIKNKCIMCLVDMIVIVCVLFNIYVCSVGSLAETSAIAYGNNNSLPYKYRTSINYSNYTLYNKSWQIIDKYISSEEPIAYIADYDGLTFPYFDNYMKRKIYYFEIGKYCDVDGQNNQVTITTEGKEFLRENNIHILHINGYKGREFLRINNANIFINKDRALTIDDDDFTEIVEDLYYFNGGMN